MNFDAAFEAVIGSEGGYSRNPADPGGETMFGVTRKVAIQEGYTGDMHILSREFAKDIYRRRYWDVIKADELPAGVRLSVFDAAVNSGTTQAVKWLQRCVDVGEDGLPGPLTLDAASRMDTSVLVMRFNAHRLDFMTSLPTWGSFSRGWVRRVASILLSPPESP